MPMSSSDDKSAKFRLELLSISQAVLDGKYPILLAASDLMLIASHLGVSNQSPFSDVIMAAESDSHGLPIFSDSRKLYSESFLAEKDLVIKELEDAYRAEMTAACHEILTRFSSKSNNSP